MIKNQLLLGVFVFTVVFCSPALIPYSFKTYKEVEGSLGIMLYDMAHEDINLG